MKPFMLSLKEEKRKAGPGIEPGTPELQKGALPHRRKGKLGVRTRTPTPAALDLEGCVATTLPSRSVSGGITNSNKQFSGPRRPPPTSVAHQMRCKSFASYFDRRSKSSKRGEKGMGNSQWLHLVVGISSGYISDRALRLEKSGMVSRKTVPAQNATHR